MQIYIIPNIIHVITFTTQNGTPVCCHSTEFFVSSTTNQVNY